MYSETLKLVSTLGARRPVARSPFRLDQLFQLLGAADCNADGVEAQIWELWMHHPHRRVAQALERSADDIASQCYDMAETRLNALLRACPDFAEAWNKRATLYYLQQRDVESVHDIHRTLELEPRRFWRAVRARRDPAQRRRQWVGVVRFSYCTAGKSAFDRGAQCRR